MIRLLFFIGAGVLLGGITVALIGPEGAGVWAFPVGFILMGGSGTAVLLGRTMSGMPLPSAADIAAARSAGRQAVVRVDAVRQTGTLINDQPVCDLELSVQPLTGEPYRTSLRRIVSLMEIPLFQPGHRSAAVLLTDDGPELALVDDALTDEPYAGLTVPPAASLGELRLPEPGTRAWGGKRRSPIIGVGRRGRGRRITLFVLAGLVTYALMLLPYATAVSQTVSALAQGRLSADLRDPATLDSALAALTEQIGHDHVVTIYVGQDFILVNAPVSVGAVETDSWEYRRGQVTHDGPATSQPSLAEEQFSLSEVAWPALWGHVADAAAEQGLDGYGDASLYLRRGVDDDIHGETFGEMIGTVEASFTIEGDYSSASYRMSADGSSFERLS